jgi:hypothetical protein
MMHSTLHATKIASRVASRNNGALRHMSKEIKFGVEGRAAMMKGVDTLADAVQVRFFFIETNRENSITLVVSTAAFSSETGIFLCYISANLFSWSADKKFLKQTTNVQLSPFDLIR